MRLPPKVAQGTVIFVLLAGALFAGLRWTGRSAAVPDLVGGNCRGYLTTPRELASAKQKATGKTEPYKAAVEQVIASARNALPSPAVGVIACNASTSPPYLHVGGPLVYACALAYHLTGEATHAEKAKGGIAGLYRIEGFVPTGDGPITVGRRIPDFIRAADLLEHYWTAADKRAFQDWLAAKAYPVINLEAQRANNHGAVATNALAYIADYLHDRADASLGGLTPAQAYQRARQIALDRLNGLRWDEGRCPEGIAMIRPDGAIPDELRRASDCYDTRITYDSPAHTYTEGFIAATVSQAELSLRRGDSSLYDNVMRSEGQTPGGKLLPAGRGSLRKAIEFVIITNNLAWQKKQTLMVAARYYRTPEMLAQARDGRPYGANTSDYLNHFTTLTHDYAEGENPGPPPMVPPPGG